MSDATWKAWKLERGRRRFIIWPQKKSSRRVVISRQPVAKLAYKSPDNRSSKRNEPLTLETRKRILVSMINYLKYR